MSASDAVERFLASGEHDPRFSAWDGDVVARRREGTRVMRDVLRKVMAWRSRQAPLGGMSTPPDLEARVRDRMIPLVRGMFGGVEAERLLAVLPSRVVMVTPASFPALVDAVPLRTAWDLANLLLDELGAPPLADDAPALHGLCANGRAWVLPRALDAAAAFPDVIVHETAHLLHSVDRLEAGLAGRGRVLPVPPRRRETFAWGCELWAAYGGPTDQDVSDSRVDLPALTTVLEAAAAGGGWRTLRGWGETGRLI